MKKNKPMSVTLFFFLFCLSIPLPLSAGGPTDLTRTTVQEVLAVLENPRLKPDAREKERRAQLRQVIYPRFDFAEMAKRSLGFHWRRRTPEERREFVEIFTELLERFYLNHIKTFNDGKFFYTRETQDKNYAEVDTKIITKKGEEFSINYKLHLINGKWKFYDVVIENISIVNNYRSQFHRVITHTSYEELLRRMKGKADGGGGKEKKNGESQEAIRGRLHENEAFLREIQRLVLFIRFARPVRRANFLN